MASSAKERSKVLEGIFAINKPPDISSGEVVRRVQRAGHTSTLFGPWLTHERRRLTLVEAKQRSIRNLKLKVGHGGTLDPMATGVLIIGVGKGTKCLERFLHCTKSYECVVLFGVATDSYDGVGKVVSRAPYEHVTKEKVEEALEKFRGKIKQKPSIFSALKVDGKKMYEYARAGGEVPEVKARDVEVLELEMTEWLPPGSHEHKWPEEEVSNVESIGAEKLLGVRDAKETVEDANESRGLKRERTEDDPGITISESAPKKPRINNDATMSGALPVQEPEEETTENTLEDPPSEINPTTTNGTNLESPKSAPQIPLSNPQPPAARLRMTVTSGFYVRSLCHDLGLALSTLGLMSSLTRTRQATYTLHSNVLEFSDLEAGEETWGPKVQTSLEEFMEKEGWEPEEVVMDEGEWERNRESFEGLKREEDRETSFRGKQRGDRNWKGNFKRGRGNRSGRRR